MSTLNTPNASAQHPSPRGCGTSVAACTLLLAIAVGPALGSQAIDPYGGATVQNDSDLFATAPAFAVLDPRGERRLADTVYTVRGGLDVDYLFDLQHFYATLEGRRIDYDHFTELNHDEYLVNLGLAWKLTSRFDGLLDARREKKIIAFADADSTLLQIQTDQIVRATFNVALTPNWRLESQASSHTLDYPIIESPDFQLQETLEGAGIKYVGVANLAYGIEGTHLEGRYHGVSGASDYQQSTGQFSVRYNLGGVTRVNGAVGYTDRTIDGASKSVAGVTGLVGYDRQLTGKTSVNLQLQRAVNSYYTAGSSEIDTGGTVAVLWQAAAKVGLQLSYQRMHSSFEGATLQDQLTLGRVDNVSYSGIELRYRPLRWLLVRPYVKRQVRHSNLFQFAYTDTQLGIEVLAQRERPNP